MVEKLYNISFGSKPQEALIRVLSNLTSNRKYVNTILSIPDSAL